MDVRQEPWMVRRELAGNLANPKDVRESGALVALGEEVAVPAAP